MEQRKIRIRFARERLPHLAGLVGEKRSQLAEVAARVAEVAAADPSSVARLLRETEVDVGGGRRRLSYVLVREASRELVGPGGSPMYKFNVMPGVTCPGAGLCLQECYAMHGNFVRSTVAEYMAASTAFVDAVFRHLAPRVGAERAVAALAAILASAVKAEAEPGSIIRLHEAGDFYAPYYIAAWLGAARMLPEYTIYTYTKTFPTDPGFLNMWRRALELYRTVWGDALPENFAVNISATVDNYKTLPTAAEGFRALGVKVPAVFFYISADFDKYVEDTRDLAKSLLEAARRTDGRTLVVEFEHGVSRSRTAKSAGYGPKVVETLIEEAKRAGIALTVAVPRTADDDVRSKALEEIAAVVAKHAESSRRETEGNREVTKYEIPGGLEHVEVFLEPAGTKQCNVCRRCVMPRTENAVAETPQNAERNPVRRRRRTATPA